MAGMKEFIEELLEPLTGTTVRRMFGGHGVFRDGVMFGILDDDVLYFRADEATQRKYEAEQSKQFTYPARGRLMALPYWRVPERLFDDTEEFIVWAKAGFAAAMQAKADKKPKSRKAAAKSKPATKSGGRGAKAGPKKKTAPKRR